MTDKIYAARAALHMWEEPCISGSKGSGAVFFTGCGLRCCFCQNREIAIGKDGCEINVKRLAEIFLELQEKGAVNVLISMAGDGAILITEDGQNIKMGTPKGKVVNSVGAGDSMVAGFITGYIRGGNYEEALKSGTAAGSATAFSEGLASLEMYEKMLKQITE